MNMKFTENPSGKNYLMPSFLRQKIMVRISIGLRIKQLFSVN